MINLQVFVNETTFHLMIKKVSSKPEPYENGNLKVDILSIYSRNQIPKTKAYVNFTHRAWPRSAVSNLRRIQTWMFYSHGLMRTQGRAHFFIQTRSSSKTLVAWHREQEKETAFGTLESKSSSDYWRSWTRTKDGISHTNVVCIVCYFFDSSNS